MIKDRDRLPLILITNDDGINAKGLEALIEIVRPFGEIIIVAPEKAASGMSNAITIADPVRVTLIKEYDNIKMYSCKGTPVDCIKLSIHELLRQKPDFIVSGINHGSNISISVIYSGTMGAVTEGCIHGVPSMGLSLADYSSDADFTSAIHFGKIILKKIIENSIPEHICLNVNIPKSSIENIKGIKICRQAKGTWKEEYEKRIDPHLGVYYWLTGDFENFEPESIETDDWALKNNYISIVPIIIDYTSHSAIEYLKEWNYEAPVN
jgi:5'-nucleotidase